MQRFDSLGMDRALDEPTIVCRDRPFRLGFNETAGQFEDGEIGIDPLNHAGPSHPPSPLRRPASGAAQVHLLVQHNAPRRLETARARQFVAMQASDALQKDIDRTQISDEQISVDVEALFQSLRADDDHAAPGARSACGDKAASTASSSSLRSSGAKRP